MDNAGKRKNCSILYGAVIALSMSFIFFIYAPFELYITNQLEFWFTAAQMLPYALALFAAAFLIILIVMYAAGKINEKLYYLISAACLCVLVCSWIQGSFLVGNLPAMNGEQVDWSRFPVDRLCSVVLWIVVITAAIILAKKIGLAHFVKAGAFVGLAVVFILSVTLVTLFLTTDISEKDRALIATDDDMFAYSDDENFLILVLDAVDSTAFEQSMERDEHYSEIFSDFTYFRNTVGAYPYSQLSIPYILTGHWYEAEQDFNSYERDAMADSPLFRRLDIDGYRKGLYSNDSSLLASVDADSFENLSSDKPVPDSRIHMCKLVVKMAIIKHAPWDFKRFGYDLSSRLSESVKYSGDGDKNYFDWSDLSFYNRLQNDSVISVGGEKRFKYIHLEGAHQPHCYDKYLNVLESSPYRDVIEANFTMIDLFLKRMKEAGVYDNTAIIIMSDHGSHNDTDLIGINQNPILLIKGFGESHNDMAKSYAPVSYEDLQEGYQRIIDGAQADEVFDCCEGDSRVRRYMWYELVDTSIITEYEQTGSAEDMSTLMPSGRVYSLNE